MTTRLESTKPGDSFFDFCLWEYTPNPPAKGKLRSASILFHSFDVTGIDERIFDLVETIRGEFGVSNTVWGVKQSGRDITWEFYFYDYRRRERERSITRFLDLVRPFSPPEVSVNENLPYFMFSVDINDHIISGSRNLDEIHLYIGNTGSTVSSGISYSLTKHGTRLENLYYFFDARTQMKQIVGKAACSSYFDEAQASIDDILWPELCDCSVIVVANKQRNDSVYFSRISVDQLIFFLRRMGYPRDIWSFIEKHRSRFDHLVYDVGFDYRMVGDGLVILKSGYYGVF